MAEIKNTKREFNRKAQSIMEYALLTAAVATAFVAMQIFINRTVQAKLKMIEDQINEPVVVINP
ncbi:MAG: hypothetical protein ABIA97_04175 [Candidatus Omnitrophota bacterium]